MKENAPGLKVKASGNIRTISDVRKVIKAGVDFIGTSSGIQIMKELLKKV
jgi:deoxyribose-phosphate aldolase